MDGQPGNNRYSSSTDSLNSSLEGEVYDSRALDDATPIGGVAVGVLGEPTALAVVNAQKLPPLQRRRGLVIGLALACIAFMVAGLLYLMVAHRQQSNNQQSQSTLPVTVSPLDLSKLQANGLYNAQQLNINGTLQVNKGLVLTPSGAPVKPVEGQMYLDASTHQLYYYDGTSFVSLTPTPVVPGVSSLGGATGNLNLGGGLSTDGLSISNTGVLSLNGLSGGITLNNASSTDGVSLTIDDASTTDKGIASFNPTNFLVNGGAVNTVQNIDSTAIPTFAGVQTASISSGSGLTLSSTSGGSTTVLAFQSPTANVVYTLRTAPAGNYDICTTMDNCSGGGSGNVSTAGGTTNQLAKFSGGLTIADSIISDNGTTVTIGGGLTVTGSPTFSSLGAGLVQSSGGGALSSSAVDRNSATFFNSALNIGNGGTGLTSVSANLLLLGNSAGNGITQLAAGNGGDCLVSGGGGAAPSYQSCPGASGVSQINGLNGAVTLSGTANQVILTPGGNTLTFSTPQNIATASSPTFANLTVTSAVNAATLTATGLIQGGGLTINNAGIITLNNLTGGASTCLTLDASNHVGTATCATGSGSSPTLQNVYDNSVTTPNILLSSTGKGITIQDAASPVGGNLLAVKNNAGNTTYLAVATTGTSINGGLSASGSIKFSSLANGVAVIDGSGNVTAGSINLGALPSYISGTLGVGNGGTGSSSFNANGVVYYDGSVLTTGAAGTDNQCLLGHTSGAPTFGTCTGAGGVSSVTANNTAQTGALQFNGTANEISVTNSSTTFTFMTPQAIATGSDVQFNSVNATSLLKTNGTTRIDASGNLSNIGNIAAAGTITLSGLSPISSTTCLVLDGSNNVGTTNCATGSGSSPTLQNVYDNSNTTPNILLSSTGKGVTIQDASSSVGGNLLAVKNNAGTTTYLGVTTSGVSVTGSLSVSSNVTLSSLTGGAAANECLTTDNSGQLLLVNCLSGGSGGSGGVASLNSLSGSITLDNATTSLQHVIINNAKADDSTKGIATFNSGNFSDNGSGKISIKTGGVTTTEIADGTIINNDLAGGTYGSITGTGALAAGSIASGFGTIATVNTITGTTVNGTTGINTGAGAGSQRIDSNGNLVNIGTINTSGLITGGNGLTVSAGTITLNNLTGGVNQCLMLDASHVVNVGACPVATGNNPTLQNVYDNSTTAPNIILSSTGGGITIQDASTTVGSLLAVNNNANTTTYLGVTASGTSVNGTFSATGAIQFSNFTSAGAVLTDASGNLSRGTINLASGTYVSGTLAVGNGGTGLNTLTTNGLLYASSSSAISQVANGTTGQCLLSNTGAAPTFGSCTSGGGIGSSGTQTQNKVAKFGVGGTTVTDSQITDNGTHVSVGGTAAGGGLFNVGGSDQFQVSTTGGVTAVGVNSGAGLLQGSGGLTLSGGSVTFNNSLTSDVSTTCLVLDGSNVLHTNTCAAGSGSGNYIQNQNSISQGANFRINGSGQADTSFLTPTVDVAAAGTLSLGTSTATAVSIGKSGVTTTIQGPLTSSGLLTANAGITATGGAFSLTGNAASTLATANAATSAGITLQTGNSTAGTAGTVLIDTGTSTSGTSKVNIGTANASEIHLGSGSNTIDADSNIIIANNKNLTINATGGAGTVTQNYVNGSNGSAHIISATNSSTAGASINGITVNPSGTNASGSNTINGLNFGNASNGAGGSTTFNGLNFGTGYTNLLKSNDATLSSGGTLTLGAGSSTGAINVTNNSATTTLSVNTSATPTTAVIVANDTSGTATDKLLSLQATSSPKFTVDAGGSVVATGTYNTNTFTSSQLQFGANATATISSNGANILAVDTGAAASLNLGTTNANALSISKSGVTTTINGSLTSTQLLTASAGVTIATGSTFTNASSTLNSALTLSNFPADGSIGGNGNGGAAGTVDTHTAFTINQTSGSGARALTIPSPTSTAAGRIIYIANIGSATFNIGSVVVSPSANASFLWNGSSWAATDVSTGVSLIGTLDGQAATANGATINGNTIYLQSADGTHPGLVNTTTQTFGGDKTFTGNVAVQGSTGITIGINAVTPGNLVLATGGTNSVTITSQNQATASLTVSIPTIVASDTFCLAIKSNCSATGTAGGDLSGTYPNPTVAKIQSIPVTFSSVASGDVLQFSGTSSIINGHITNTNLTQGTFANITGVGAQTVNFGFAENAGSGRTVNIAQRGSAGAGDTLTIQGGQGNGAGKGGDLLLQGGAQGTSGGTGSVIVKANGTDSATAFMVKNSSNVAIFTVDTTSTSGTITFGTGLNTLTFGSGGSVATGTFQHAKSIVLTPEYAGAVLDAASDSGGANCTNNNNGIMTSGYQTGIATTGGMSNSTQNYYKWSANAAAQCYDVILQVQVPSDFSAWNNTLGAFFINDYTSDTTNGKVEVQILDSSTSATVETNYNYANLTPGSTTTWTQKSAATNTFGGSYTAGKYMTIRIRMTSPNAGDVRIGNVTLNYLSSY